ncbi:MULTISPECIES: hypothetical protein [unclassified Mannheimia]|uniref:hypothetical protein n=1 Tax=unclassified Mannheimia TaxID=2645054 RepID=UPI00359D4FC9
MGFLDIFRFGKKNEITESVKSSISTTNKLLSQAETGVSDSGKEAYDLGMRYLNEYPINFDLARENFKKAVNLGYAKARDAAYVIGLETPNKIGVDNATEIMLKAVNNYKNNQQHIGDLVYFITYDLKYNIFNTSSDPVYYASRFIDYEVYCMREYGNDVVYRFHNKSSLKNWKIKYTDDWESGEIPRHSEYLNEKSFPMISALSGISMMNGDMAVLRAAVVVDILDNYLSNDENENISKKELTQSKENLESLRKEFWDNLSPMWKRILGGNLRCQEMIKSYGGIMNTSGSLAEDIYIFGRKFETSSEYPDGLFDITEIKYPYKGKKTIHSFGASIELGGLIEIPFISELPDFSLFPNLEELVIYQDKINAYFNLSTIKSLTKLTLSFPNGTSSNILSNLPSSVKELTFAYLKIDNIDLFSGLHLDRIILAGCYTKNGLLVNPDNLDKELIKQLLPNTELIIRNYL